MSGSFRHVIGNDGSLRSNKDINDSVENGGDVYEAIEEMYGMIWWLADSIAGESFGKGANPALYVDDAQEHYKGGLKISPTERYKEKKLTDAEALAKIQALSNGNISPIVMQNEILEILRQVKPKGAN